MSERREAGHSSDGRAKQRAAKNASPRSSGCRAIPADLPDAQQAQRALQSLDDAIERLGDVLERSFPPDRAAESILVSDEMLRVVHDSVRQCVECAREAGAPADVAAALVELRVREFSAHLPVHPAIAAAIHTWVHSQGDD